MTKVQASFMIVTYNRQNIFIIQATDLIPSPNLAPTSSIDNNITGSDILTN
jgi:hypothetical protein